MKSVDKSPGNLNSALKRISQLEKHLGLQPGSSEEKIYSAIINQSPVGISVRDHNGNLVLCNQSWVDIWEMSDENVKEALSSIRTELQMDHRDRYLGENQSKVQRIYEKGGDLILEAIYSRKLAKWIQQRFYGIEGASGSIQYVVVLTEDVTDRKKAERIERELQKSTMKYRKLVENLPVAAYTTNPRGQCIFANMAMVEMFEENSKEELYKTSVADRYVNPVERDIFLSEMLISGKVQGYEVELVTAKGRPFWASISATAVLDENGIVSTVDGIIRDISSVKVLEKEMLKNQKLESIGILAGGIAHDFNNILAAILGNISLAKLYASGDKRISDKLREAEKASIRASELTKQLLTFSRGGKPVRKTCDIRGIVRESASFAATGSGTVVKFSLPDDLWAAEVDESQIGQVINNLVLNAVQASPDGCEVLISASNTDLKDRNPLSLSPGSYIKLMVKDNGPGITTDIQGSIFDPYFSTKPSGSGLGLATVYSIIKNHSGSVTVESSPGNGSEFLIHLPSIGESISLPSENQRYASPGRGKILVMDDEESVREVVSEILNQHGYTADTAAEGTSAVEMYRSSFLEGRPYDAVITDVTVPGGLGGIETAQRILRIDPSARIIVASGYSNNTAMANYRDHGFRDSIVKPFEMDTLLMSVEKVLNE